MANSILVSVSLSNIKRGKVGCFVCPIALALQDAFPGQTVKAGYRALVIGSTTIPTPVKVNCAMRHFDIGGGMQPFAFTLELPTTEVARAS